jgi:gliding motility-associated lipoprotein GldD
MRGINSARQQAVGSRQQIALLTAYCLLMAAFFSSCSEDVVPKPRGYPRLDLPQATYQRWSGNCPFDVELPTYALALEKPGTTPAIADTACYMTLRFPGQRANVYLTCRRIQGDLRQLIEDAHAFKDKHEAMAARIRSERVERDSARVFGTLFDVEGNVASPMVFYLTDSTTRFLYGSLYFDARPNADSLEPVTGRIREDLRHFAGTLKWR